MTIAGRVIDNDSRDPVPGATVELWTGSVMLARGAASDYGYFSINTTSSPDKVLISSASYMPGNFPLIDVSTFGTYKLERDVKEIDPVTVTARIPKKAALIGWAMLLLLSILFEKK